MGFGQEGSSSATPTYRRCYTILPYWECDGQDAKSDHWRRPITEADRCRAMWRSVLCQTIKDALGIGEVSLGCTQSAKREARAWFFQNGRRTAHWQFIIETLDFCEEEARKIEQLIVNPLSAKELLHLLNTSRYNSLKQAAG